MDEASLRGGMWGKVTITLNIRYRAPSRLKTFFQLFPHLSSTSLTSGLDRTGNSSWSRFALLRTGLDAPIHTTIATIAIAIAIAILPLPIDSLSFSIFLSLSILFLIGAVDTLLTSPPQYILDSSPAPRSAPSTTVHQRGLEDRNSLPQPTTNNHTLSR